MCADNLKRHHGFRIELESSVKAAREIALSRENAHRAEKADVVFFADVVLDTDDGEKSAFI